MIKRRAEQFSPHHNVTTAISGPQCAANGCFGFACGCHFQPRRLGHLALGGDNVDRLSIAQTRPQRYAQSINFGAHAAIADARVDRIGKINRRGTFGEFEHIALGRKAKHLIGVHFQFHRLKKGFVIGFCVELVDQLGDPLDRIHRKAVL